MSTPSRYETATHPAVYAAIIASIAALFAIDVLTPRGISVWIFYIVPLMLCLLTRRPMLPIYTGIICSILLLIGYFLATPATAAWVSQLNRGFGLVVIWGIAILARIVITAEASRRRENWLDQAQVEMVERIRGDLTPAQLGSKLLDLLMQKLQAQAGIVYALERGRLAPIAALSTDVDTGQLPSFGMDEGLVGQVFRRRSAYAVEQVPQAYFSLRSGLGANAPGSLVLSPFLADTDTVGAIELAFFGGHHEADLALLDRLNESLGIALKTARLRAIRQELLEETQRQSEELQAQQEELRVANEELEQQASHLREAQARLELQQSELEQNNSQLEEHTSLLARHNEDLSLAKRELDDKASALERANQYKSEFLANMSHELRTPLNSALILAKLLSDNKDGNLSGEQIKFARSIYSAGNDLLELINDILDLSKVETGKVDFVPESLDLQKLCESLMQSLRPLAEQRGIGFTLSVDADAPRNIETDSQRLRQILRNLLSNAIKFTERGEVSLRVMAAGMDGVGFAVRDTGIGIAAHQRSLIWEPFRQADGTTSRKYGGTGLGLSISRELALLLGGNIELDSEIGSGSTFTLTLPRSFRGERASLAATPMPLATAATPIAAHPDTAPHTPSRAASVVADDRGQIAEGQRSLLVVEDDPTFAEVLYKLARSNGFHCLVAGTADEGIELAREYRPTAIVLDMRLPDHSGLSVLDRLKHDSTTRHIPVQVVSAADYTQPALEMGAAGVMMKPIKPDELLAALGRLESRRSEALRSVLVVEDNLLQRESVCQLLDSQSVRTVPVANASEALEALRQATFDCMVLDLALPDASGYELLEMMAQDERYSFPPVIVYTGRSLSQEEELRLRKYSTSIIIKGAKSPERLLDEVTLFLHQVESTLPPDRQRMLREARSREAALEGRHLLLVEDDVRNVFALTSILEPAGARVSIARNGREALDALTPEAGIDLVLMDMMMPEMDGLEATRRIRAQPALARIPVIALTAKAMPDDRRRCLEAGANDYVTKPIDVEKLLSLIRIWMPRNRP